jgi:acyl-CoA synthetase (AMP-forming)/AMP-acid ligase II
MTAGEAGTAQTISAMIAAHAARDSRAHAIRVPAREPLTYSELCAAIGEISGALRASGLGADGRVGLVLPNGAEMAVAFLAVASAMTCVPLNPAYREDDLAFAFADLGVGAVITMPEARPAIAAAARLGLAVIEMQPSSGEPSGLFRLSLVDGRAAPARESGPEDLALVLHTSGTTSRPKIVPLSQRNLCASAHNVRRALALAPADVCLSVMPLFYIHGLVGALLASIAAGATVAFPAGARASDLLDGLLRSRATWYTAVPTIHLAVLEAAGGEPEAARRNGMRFIRSSSAPLPRRTLENLESTFGVPVIEAYGMTEASHQIASNPLASGRRKVGSVGVAAGPEIAILDGDGDPVPALGVGEVAIRGETVTRGQPRSGNASSTSSRERDSAPRGVAAAELSQHLGGRALSTWLVLGPRSHGARRGADGRSLPSRADGLGRALDREGGNVRGADGLVGFLVRRRDAGSRRRGDPGATRRDAAGPCHRSVARMR